VETTAVTTDIPEEFKVPEETVDAYLDYLKKIVPAVNALESWVESLPITDQRMIRAEQRVKKLEKDIKRAEHYRDFMMSFANEPMEMSFEKIPIQYDYWRRMARQLLNELEDE